jgi:hypothetical protein
LYAYCFTPSSRVMTDSGAFGAGALAAGVNGGQFSEQGVRLAPAILDQDVDGPVPGPAGLAMPVAGP